MIFDDFRISRTTHKYFVKSLYHEKFLLAALCR